MVDVQWNAERKLILVFGRASAIKYRWFFNRYAKALHYKEQEFHADKSPQVLEALILINNKLQQKEAAEGLLECVMSRRSGEEEPKVSSNILCFVYKKDVDVMKFHQLAPSAMVRKIAQLG